MEKSHMMKDSFKFVATLITDAVFIFIGIYGVTFGLITAYEIELNAGMVVMAEGLCALVLAAICRLRNRVLCTVAFSLYAVAAAAFFIYKFALIANGFSVLMNALTSKLAIFYGTIKETALPKLTSAELLESNTAFFCFAGILLVLYAALTLIIARQPLFCFIVLLPLFILCLVFLENLPDKLPLLAFILFIICTVATSLTRRGGRAQASEIVPLFLAIGAVLLLVIICVTGDEEHEKLDQLNVVQRIYEYSIKHEKKNISEIIEDNFEVTEVDRLSIFDMRAAERAEYTGEPVMSFITTKQGKTLLRGMSYGDYLNNTWQMSPENITEKQAALDFALGSYRANRFFPLALSSVAEGTVTGEQAYKAVLVDNIGKGELIHLPYFTDSNILDRIYAAGNGKRGDFAMTSTVELSTINFTIYGGDELFALLGAVERTERLKSGFYYNDMKLGGYDEYVYANYLGVDENTSELLSEVFLSNGEIDRYASPETLIKEVKRAVSSFGSYNLDYSPTPRGRDILEYFLTESGEGVCFHYASAATLLFRMLNIPARYTVGYVTERTEPILTGYLAASAIPVTDEQAHAWVEVYVVGIGWLPVDVTPANENEGETESETSSTTNENDSERESESETESESESESDTTEENEGSTSRNEEKSGEGSTVTLLIVIALVAVAAGLPVRRELILRGREKRFKDPDKNRAMIEVWLYIERMIPYGIAQHDEYYALAQKARFSKREISAQELDKSIAFANQSATKIDSELKPIKRAIFRYIKVLK